MIYSFLRYIGIVLLFQFSFCPNSLAQETPKKPYHEQLIAIENKLRTGAFEDAFQIMDEVTAKYPDADEVYYAKALLFGQFRNYDAAVSNMQQAIALNKDLRYYQFLIELYKSTSDFDSILTVLDELIVEKPNVPQPYREKIMLLQGMKRTEEAFAFYETTKGKFGLSDTLDLLRVDLLMSQQKDKEAKEILKSWEQKNSTLSAVYARLAHLYLQDKGQKQALATLHKGLSVSQDDKLYQDLVEVHTQARNPKQASVYLRKIIESDQIDFQEKVRVMRTLLFRYKDDGFSIALVQELANTLVLKHPRMAESHLIKGDVLWKRNDLQEARTLFLVAVGINPAQIDAWRLLINVDLALQDLDAAIAHGQEGLRANPDNPMLLYFTGLVYFRKDDKDHAREFLEAALNHSEKESPVVQSSIYTALGDLYHYLKLESASDVAYEEAVKLDSTNASAMNNLAYYLSLRKKELDKAAEYSKRSNKIRPNVPIYQDTYAWVLFRQGKHDEALIWIEKAIKNSESASGTLWDHYGDILFHLGKEKEALKKWKKALTLPGLADLESEKTSLKIKKQAYVE